MCAALDAHNCYFDFDVDCGEFWWSLICQILSHERGVRSDAGLLHCAATVNKNCSWLSGEQETCANNILCYFEIDRFIFLEIMDVPIFLFFYQISNHLNHILVFF